MLGIYYLICALVVATVITVGLLLHKKAPKYLNILFKTVSLVLATALFFRYMLNQDNFIKSWIVNLQPGGGFTDKGLIVVALIQIWLAYAAEMLVILASFFKVKVVPATVTYFASSVFILNTVLMASHIAGIEGPSALDQFNVRAMLMAIETGLGIGYCTVHTVTRFNDIQLKKKEWLWFALAVVGMIFAAIPSYAFQVVLNSNQITMVPEGLSYYHRLYLYPMAIIPIVLYLCLKDKPLETRKFAMMYYAWL